MNKEELTDKMADAIKEMKAETNKGVIIGHAFDTVVNWQTGKETGLAAVLICSTKFEYTEAVFNRWKQLIGADEFRIKVNRSKLFITFMVYYKED